MELEAQQPRYADRHRGLAAKAQPAPTVNATLPLSVPRRLLMGGITGGRIRPLAVAYAARWPSLPEVPTMEEAGVPDLVVPSWHALVAPRGLPAAIQDRLAAATVATVTDPAFRARILELGSVPVASTPAGLVAFTAEESTRYGALIRQLGIRAD